MRNDVWIRFEGYWLTTRTVAMIQEARFLFGPGYPRIVQGGRNKNGVSASAGTHDLDAVDFATRWMSRTEQLRWELCCWMVGFASWIRPRIIRLWESHSHAIPKWGLLSELAGRQQTAFLRYLDGLATGKPYPRIKALGLARRRWESYKRPVKEVRVSALAAAMRAGTNPGAAGLGNNDGEQLQRALQFKGLYRYKIDGKLGPESKKAYLAWQRRMGFKGKDADGIPAPTSLKALGLTPR